MCAWIAEVPALSHIAAKVQNKMTFKLKSDTIFKKKEWRKQALKTLKYDRHYFNG